MAGVRVRSESSKITVEIWSDHDRDTGMRRDRDRGLDSNRILAKIRSIAGKLSNELTEMEHCAFLFVAHRRARIHRTS